MLADVHALIDYTVSFIGLIETSNNLFIRIVIRDYVRGWRPDIISKARGPSRTKLSELGVHGRTHVEPQNSCESCDIRCGQQRHKVVLCPIVEPINLENK